MRIATWNLNRPDKRSCPQQIPAELLAVNDVDVWVLTEAYTDLPPSDGFRLVTNSKPNPPQKWLTTIWVRGGLAAEPIPTCGNSTTSTACVKLADTDIGPLYVYGTVLWAAPGTTYDAQLEEQARDWQRIKNLAADSQSSLCLAGDFNQKLGNPGQDTETAAALRSALKELELTCLTEDLTYPVADQGPGSTIDHICIWPAGVPSAISLIPDSSRKCLFRRSLASTDPEAGRFWYTPDNKPLSDHNGVVVTLATLR
jgi:hypothetical protein